MTPVLLHETVFAPTAHWCSPAVECGIFPGICVKPDGSLALLAVCGNDFESADQRVVSYAGSADGTQWTPRGDWGEIRSNGHLFNVTAKPTLLPDGTLLALGYGYERDLPDLSISEYAEKHGRFPTVRNFVAYSHDGGRIYNLKFGQPSLTRLADETALLVFWRKSPAGRYEIVIRKYQGL